jgi:8-oxo-dGTP diphosphatase
MVIFARSKKQALQTLNADIGNLYGGSVRVRVGGLCVQEHRILLVNHALYGPEGIFWSPPGGGVQFGESAQQALVREFREETGLDVEVGELLFVHEHIAVPLHAVEPTPSCRRMARLSGKSAFSIGRKSSGTSPASATAF